MPVTRGGRLRLARDAAATDRRHYGLTILTSQCTGEVAQGKVSCVATIAERSNARSIEIVPTAVLADGWQACFFENLRRVEPVEILAAARNRFVARHR